MSGKSSNNDNVNAIVHNGAIVNWNADYDKLRAANVYSTTDLLEAATMSPIHPKFVFVYGGVKSDPTQDNTAITAALGHANGYAQTKFVSEAIIQEAINKSTKCRLPRTVSLLSSPVASSAQLSAAASPILTTCSGV